MAVNDVSVKVSEFRPGGTANWRAESVCRQHPTRWWFAGGHRETVLAKGICADCPVRSDCLEFALNRPELLGIWAATTPGERAAMRRAQRDPVVGIEAGAESGATAQTVQIAREPKARIDLDLVLEAARETERSPEMRDLNLVREVGRNFESEAEREPTLRRGRRPGRAGGFADRGELLTPAEAARLLGVTPNTVTRWSRAGKISAIQTMGGHRRFRRLEIERVQHEANFAAPDSI